MQNWKGIKHFCSCHDLKLISKIAACAEGPRRLSLTRRTSDRLAIKWYGSLEKRPISKASSGALSPPSSDRARAAAAWSAYADLDGPKH